MNKVAGNFHFLPGKGIHQSNFHVHDLLAFQTDGYNVRKILFPLDTTSKIMDPNLNLAIGLWYYSSFLFSSKTHVPIISNSSSVIQISHKINKLTFGDYFPGVLNPLDG